MQKNILITGASRGLGNGLAVKYLEAGFRVFACVRDINSTKLNELKKIYGDHLQVIEMDISETISVEKAAVQIKAMTGSLDIIINNAGIHAEGSFNVLEEINVDDCLEVYNVNTLGALRVAKAFLDLLDKENRGILVNISSESGSMTNCFREKEFDYCMSKTALNMQSVLLQNYLKTRNIKVLAIHPGWFRSDMGGPNAHLAVSEAAEGVVAIIEKTGNDLNAPIFIDHTGNTMSY